MHTDEFDIDGTLVAALLDSQFPRWASLELTQVPSAGTDNALFRLGEDMVVRLPRIASAAGQVEQEHRWLPRLAPRLPLAIPAPLVKGGPTSAYPWPWSVYVWLEGADLLGAAGADLRAVARGLATFVVALRKVDLPDGPTPGAHNSFRGASPTQRDEPTRAAIDEVRDTFDPNALTTVWEEALDAPAWEGPPVWIHGDLLPTNLLARAGELSAVIDFGCLSRGDPAWDVMAAWTVFDAGSRDAYRAAVRVDDATWARARGFALSIALVALPYYRDSNPVLAGVARRTIEEVLADH